MLLGLTPPRLSARALVELGELFGISPGTMRTALSRMSTNGELHADGGVYELSGRLLDRKAAQDAGRRPAPDEWDGTWWIAVVVSERRSVAERRVFRSAMTNARMGELQPAVWMRPANLPGPTGDARLAVARSPIDGTDTTALTTRLWDLPALDRLGRLLLDRLAAAHDRLEAGDYDSLVDTVQVSAAAVRFLRSDPLLPAVLRPPDWAADELRRRYGPFDRAFGRLLNQFLAENGG